MSEEEWLILTSLGVRVRFNRHEILFRQGGSDTHLYILLSGTAKVVRAEPDGRETVLTLRAAGDVVGEMAALDRKLRSATVVALTPLVARHLTADQFRRFIVRPSVYDPFMRYVLAKVRDADEQRTELAVLPVRLRLARALLRLARSSDHRDGAVEVQLSQQDLAQIVGASRNAVVQELTMLRAAGILSTTRGAVVILDAAALAGLSEA